MSLDAVLATLFRVSAKNTMQRPKRHPSEFRARQANSCQRRLGELPQIDIVKAYDRQILRDSKTRVVNGTQRTKRGEVIRCKNCRRAFFQLQQTVHGGGAAVDFVIPLDDETAISGKIVFVQAMKECRATSTGGLKV